MIDLHQRLLAAGVLGGTLAILAATSTPPAEPARSTAEILESYVADFRKDRAAAEPRTFGVRVSGSRGGDWTVVVSGVEDDDGHWGVELREGSPEEPTFVYTVDPATLAKIDAGSINAITAQGKAFSGDVAPMDVEWMSGAEEFDVNPFSFHFWTRGFPEKVQLGAGLTREIHGVDNVAVYYQQGIRTVWSRIEKGKTVNNGPGQPMIVPFPILVFGIAGRATGTVGGKPAEVKAGEVMFISPMTPYEFTNEDGEPAEAILVMFGKGA